MGKSQGGDCSTLSCGGQVANAGGSTLRDNPSRDSKSVQEVGNRKQNKGERGGEERQVHTRQGNEALSGNDKERELQLLPDKKESLYSSQGRQSLQQCDRESSSSLHVMSQQDAQARVVGLPKEWAILTDPPYGIDIANNSFRQKHDKKNWDKKTPDISLLLSNPCIIWGGNYFNLPPEQGFFIWDKVQPENFSSAQVEYAWNNLKKPAKIFKRHVVSYEKFHPTTKPLELMQWCIDQLPRDTQTILDPFMGSGTTLVACAKMGRKGIGIELDEDYFKIACKRVEEAYKQPDLFIEVEKHEQPEQTAMLLDDSSS